MGAKKGPRKAAKGRVKKWETRHAGFLFDPKTDRMVDFGPLPRLPKGAQPPKNICEWVEQMEEWGRRVRYDIVRLEAWLADTRDQEGCKPKFRINDPGDPPPKPW